MAETVNSLADKMPITAGITKPKNSINFIPNEIGYIDYQISPTNGISDAAQFKSGTPEKLEPYTGIKKDIIYNERTQKYQIDKLHKTIDNITNALTQSVDPTKGVFIKLENAISGITREQLTIKYDFTLEIEQNIHYDPSKVNHTQTQLELLNPLNYEVIKAFITTHRPTIEQSKNNEEIEANLEETQTKRNAFVQLLHSIHAISVCNVTANCFKLQHYSIKQTDHSSGWDKITNEKKTFHATTNNHSKITKTTITLSSNANNNATGKQQLEQYFASCENIQELYNAKHNELINLYDALRKIVKTNLDIIKFILELLNINSVRFTENGLKLTHVYATRPENIRDNNTPTTININVPTLPDLKPLKIDQATIQTTIETLKTGLENSAAVASSTENNIPEGVGEEEEREEQRESAAGGGIENMIDNLNGGAAAPVQIPPPMNISDLTATEQSFTITNFFKPIPIGQNILIHTFKDARKINEVDYNINEQQLPYAALTAQCTNITKDHTYTFKLIKAKILKTGDAGDADNTNVFNLIKNAFNLIPIKYLQTHFINFLEYVIEDDATMITIVVMRQMMDISKQTNNEFYNKMIKDTSTMRHGLDENATNGSITFNGTIDNVANKQNLEKIIYNCYDLHVLYFIKHVEVINIFKIILYFLDMFLINIGILKFAISLFKIQTTTGDRFIIDDNTRTLDRKVIPGHPGSFIIRTPKASLGVQQYISTQQGMLKTLESTLGTLVPTVDAAAQLVSRFIPHPPTTPNPRASGIPSQGGGAIASAETVLYTPSETHFKREFAKYSTIPFAYGNLDELEHKILDKIGKEGATADESASAEELTKLNKAYLLVRIERLYRFLEKTEHGDQTEDIQKARAKATKMIESYSKTLADKTGTGDIAKNINDYMDFITSTPILTKIINVILKDKSKINQDIDPFNANNKDFNSAWHAYTEYKEKNNICTASNKASCNNAIYKVSKNLISQLLHVIGYPDGKIEQLFSDLTEPMNLTQINIIFCVNTIADWIYNYKNLGDKSYKQLMDDIINNASLQKSAKITALTTYFRTSNTSIKDTDAHTYIEQFIEKITGTLEEQRSREAEEERARQAEEQRARQAEEQRQRLLQEEQAREEEQRRVKERLRQEEQEHQHQLQEEAKQALQKEIKQIKEEFKILIINKPEIPQDAAGAAILSTIVETINLITSVINQDNTLIESVNIENAAFTLKKIRENIAKLEQYFNRNRSNTILDIQNEAADLMPMINIMKAYNSKNEPQKQGINAYLDKPTNLNAQTLFNNNIIPAYNILKENETLLNILQSTDTTAPINAENYTEYMAIITNALDTYNANRDADADVDVDAYKKTRKNALINLFETIAGAVRGIINVKPGANDNTAPIISKENEGTIIKNYTGKDYFKPFGTADATGTAGATGATGTAGEDFGGGGINNMSGGYKYNDIIEINASNKQITIGDFCNNKSILGKTEKPKHYGPFSAIYPAQYNNFHIYANMFGTTKLDANFLELTQADQILEDSAQAHLNAITLHSDTIPPTISTAISNEPQRLMQKLKDNGTVVIFGYGFSGSGKTYALIEGGHDSVNCPVKPIPSYKGGFLMHGGNGRGRGSSRGRGNALHSNNVPAPAAARASSQTTRSHAPAAAHAAHAAPTPTRASTPARASTLPPISSAPAPTPDTPLPPISSARALASTSAPAAAPAPAPGPASAPDPEFVKKCIKYDPSLLEQFIKDNSGEIDTISFKEIYPKGISGKEHIKIIQSTDDTDGADAEAAIAAAIAAATAAAAAAAGDTAATATATAAGDTAAGAAAATGAAASAAAGAAAYIAAAKAAAAAYIAAAKAATAATAATAAGAAGDNADTAAAVAAAAGAAAAGAAAAAAAYIDNEFAYHEKITADMYKEYLTELGISLEEDQTKYLKDKRVILPDSNYDLYKTLIISTMGDTEDKFEVISQRIRHLERHRIHKLRILATPNNNSSSRSFLQITINLKHQIDGASAPAAAASADAAKPKPQLVFFDMPGTENTVRIKTEFMGAEIFNDIQMQKEPDAPSVASLRTTKKTSSVPRQGIQLSPEEDNLIKQIKGTEFGKNLSRYVSDNKIHKTDYFQRLIKIVNIKCNRQYIISVTKLSNMNMAADAPIDKILIDMLFKYVVLQRQQFDHYCYIHITEDETISKIGFEICAFFNGLDVLNFNEISDNKELFFITDEMYHKIFDKFMTYLTSKDEDGPDGINKFYNIGKSNKYCKIDTKIQDFKEKTNAIFDQQNPDTSINDDDANEFFNIFDIYPKTMSCQYGNTQGKLTETLICTTENLLPQNLTPNKTNYIYQDKNKSSLRTDKSTQNQFYDLIVSGSGAMNKEEIKKKTYYAFEYTLHNIFFNKDKNIPIGTDIQNIDEELKHMYLRPITFNPKLNTIYVANPLIKYLLWILFYVYKNCNYRSLTGAQNFSPLTLNNVLIRASVFFIYKYIKFIVDQGRAIVTNLEHLKFFFLSRSGQIADYNEKNKDKAFTIKDETNAKDTPTSILETDRYYTTATSISLHTTKSNVAIKKTITNKTIEEKINIGKMIFYRLLYILQKLARSNPNLKQLLAIQQTNEQNINYLDIVKSSNPSADSDSTSTSDSDSNRLGALFVMFTNLKIFLGNNKDKLNKDTLTKDPEFQTSLKTLCAAAQDTLEFTHSVVSSTAAEPKPLTDAVTITQTEAQQTGHLLVNQLQTFNPDLITNFLGPIATGGKRNYYINKFDLNQFTKTLKNKLPYNKYRKTRKVQSKKITNNKNKQFNRRSQKYII